MKLAIPLFAFVLTASATVRRETSSCYFEMAAVGGLNGTIEEDSIGENRIGGDFQQGVYLLNGTTIQDNLGNNCTIDVDSAQFRCANVPAMSGFGYTEDYYLTYDGGDQDWLACPVGDGSYNIFSTALSDSAGCEVVLLKIGGFGCAALGSSTVTATSGSSDSTITFGSITLSTSSTPVAGANALTAPYAYINGTTVTGSGATGTTTLSSLSTTAAGANNVGGSSNTSTSSSNTTLVPDGSIPMPTSFLTSAVTSVAGANNIGGSNWTTSSSSSSITFLTPTTLTSAATSAAGGNQVGGDSTASSSSSSTTPMSGTSISSPTTATAILSSCPTDISSGNYLPPHLIIPILASSPDTAFDDVYIPKLGLSTTDSNSYSTLFNFDIPTSYPSTSTCSLIFQFPSISGYNFTGAASEDNGGFTFALSDGTATTETTYNTAPAVKNDYGTKQMFPGNNYTIETFACPSGETVTFEVGASSGVGLSYFQNTAPNPFGLWMVPCA